ncbi:hypothetical protein HD806DRAFT_503217 [Xylariaceae sp. AK1471]|nr:hypothetical protein HD806DRAFT_503217 [Xylariaceae sp. AK1471]
MSSVSNMLNGHEPTGLVGEALARLNVYHQLDNERSNLIQVSLLAIIIVRRLAGTTFARLQTTYLR